MGKINLISLAVFLTSTLLSSSVVFGQARSLDQAVLKSIVDHKKTFNTYRKNHLKNKFKSTLDTAKKDDITIIADQLNKSLKKTRGISNTGK